MIKSKKFEKKQSIAYIIFLICLFFSGFIIGSYIQDRKCVIEDLSCPCVHEDCICFDDVIDKIDRDCGSTFLTKHSDSDDWLVFKKICKGEYCKSDYVKLKDCLK